jgi:hypothetical protein
MLLRNTADDTIWVLQTERLEQVRPQQRPQPDTRRQGKDFGQPPVAPCSQPAFSRRRSRCSCCRGCAHKQWRSGVVMIQGRQMLLHPGISARPFSNLPPRAERCWCPYRWPYTPACCLACLLPVSHASLL